MSVKNVITDDIRRMIDEEGLVLQGCGGPLDEWIDGINDMLTEDKILLDDTKFKADDCSVFEHNELTCILYPFDNVKLDIGKLAMWRLKTHETFGGTWLSDFVPNQLGGYISEHQAKQKPDCPLIGQDGNIFNLMGIASRTLRQNGMAEKATEMNTRIRASDSYYKALGIISEYVNITSVDDMDEDFSEEMEMS